MTIEFSNFSFRYESLDKPTLKNINLRIEKGEKIVIIGPSGSGKSSVVKAGVIPELRDGRLTGSQNFFYAEMVPGDDALEELESVLLSIAIDPPSDLRERLQASESGLHDILKEILPDTDSDLFFGH